MRARGSLRPSYFVLRRTAGQRVTVHMQRGGSPCWVRKVLFCAALSTILCDDERCERTGEKVLKGASRVWLESCQNPDGERGQKEEARNSRLTTIIVSSDFVRGWGWVEDSQGPRLAIRPFTEVRKGHRYSETEEGPQKQGQPKGKVRSGVMGIFDWEMPAKIA